ncbi:hypothetical protein GMLC_42890 [Geomonas limicola]|uniref:Alpha-1,2-fucosyltransferase n=1 Tax=Geomonas limicola TaxID=2740186 RepID=A0A6V8NE43_9BACT|nr:hypothetical protein [Geomonas limicola]GFO70710.1 hypothetical protein GMLC_42890 [Geomonas limicola]
MVIISNKSGQLGNRLFVFAHFIANAQEYGYEISNPSFFDYAHYFANIETDYFCGFPRRNSGKTVGKRLHAAYFKALKTGFSVCKALGVGNALFKVMSLPKRGAELYSLSSPEYLRLRESTRYLFVKGWLFRDPPLFDKHAALIRDYFTPAPRHAENIARLIEKARQDCDLLVGVHIRQGDYKTWEQGRYYYRSDEYAALMRRFVGQHPGKRVRFLICSNEAQPKEDFAGLDVIFGNNHQFEDMYSFAQCDLLLGPPSTYTLWASFYGSVPLFVVRSVQDPVDPDAFIVAGG